MNNKKVKLFTLILVSSIMIFMIFIVLSNGVLSNGKPVAVDNNDRKLDASDLIVPTKEGILKNGYPINENGQTYGPDLGNLLLDGPDLQLAVGENDVEGYIYRPQGISSPSEAAEYTSPVSTPLYLQDGKRLLALFISNRLTIQVLSY